MTRISYSNDHSRSDDFLHVTRKTPSSLTMLSSVKYRHREDRKRVLKLSVRKLRDIDDPETFLCRSVLINNTMKRLQNEVREEKRNSSTYNSCKSYSPSPYSYFSVEKAYREEMERVHPMCDEPPQKRHISAEDLLDSDDASSTSSSSSSSSSSNSDEEDTKNEDVDELLREVYMPPSITPHTDADDLYTSPEKSKEGASWPERPSTPIPWVSTSLAAEKNCDTWCCQNSTWSQSSEPTNVSSCDSVTTTTSTCSSYSSSETAACTTSTTSFSICGGSSAYLTEKHFSCGQTSMFGELQSVVFNSLIASLES